MKKFTTGVAFVWIAFCALVGCVDKSTLKDITDGSETAKAEAAWLRDWSENVRTNKALESCASFRETRLRPFLLREMDPSGQATESERKTMYAAVDAVWGERGFKSFGKRRELVAILDRVAKKPFAEMVRGFAEKKDVQARAVTWIESGKFRDEDMRCVFWTVRNDINYKDAKFCKLLQKADVDAWLKAMWRIGVARDKAWKSRGGGWARDVSEKGWEGYRKSGDECRAAFGEAMALKPYPEPVYFFDTLGPFPDEVFEAATRAQLDYPWLYRNYLWYNCFPRWCGSHRKMKVFAERCYATKRHDTMVPLFYAESLLRMLSDGGADGGLEAYFKDHPDELDKILEVSLPQIGSTNAIGVIRQHAGVYATLAYSLKGDWEKAGETFRSFGHATMPNAIWDYIDNFSNWWMIWDGISGPNRTRMQALHRLYATGDCRGFLQRLRDVRAQVKLSRNERVYADQMEVAARMKTTFLDGEPVVATFPKDKTMWLTYGGNWRLNGEYAFVSSKSYRGSDPLGWDVPVPGEFRLDCEIAPHDAPKDWSFVFYQMPDDPKVVSSRRYPYLKLSVAADKCRVGFGLWSEIKDFKGGEQASFPLAGDRIKLAVVYSAGHVKIFADGMEKPLIETDDYGRMLKSIKSGRLRFNGTSVRLHSLRVSSSSVVGP